MKLIEASKEDSTMAVFKVSGSVSVKVGSKFAVFPVQGKIVAGSVNEAACSESMRALLLSSAQEHAKKNQGNKVPMVGRDFEPEKGMTRGLQFTKM